MSNLTLDVSSFIYTLLALIYFQANYFRANQYCRFHGMHLASITSQEENDKLEKYIKDFGMYNINILLWSDISVSFVISYTKRLLHNFMRD